MAMKLARVVIRLFPVDRAAIDRLRDRYFEETRDRLSRAAVARALVGQALAGADRRRATEVLPDAAVARAVVRRAAAEGRRR
jgi:hypothetical protein